MQKTLVILASLSTSLILGSADLADDALDRLDDVDVGVDGAAEHTDGDHNVSSDDDDSRDEAAAGHAGVVEGSHLNQCTCPGSVTLTW